MLHQTPETCPIILREIFSLVKIFRMMAVCVEIWKILKLSEAVQSAVGIFHISYTHYIDISDGSIVLATFLMAFCSFSLQMKYFRPNFLFSVGEKNV